MAGENSIDRQGVKIGVSLMTTAGFNLPVFIEQLEESGVDFLHLDFFDGIMVKSNGLSAQECLSIRKLTKLPIEAHLMEIEPREMSFYCDLGINRIIVHHESNGQKEARLLAAKEQGMEVGIALKPSTPHNVKDIIHPDIVDLVLVLATKSGSGGKLYDEGTPDRIRQLRDVYQGLIEVNSGVMTPLNNKPEDCSMYHLFLAGARMFSLGRGILKLGVPFSEAVNLNLSVIKCACKFNGQANF